MTILITLSNHLLCEALYELLKKEGDGYQVCCGSKEKGVSENVKPNILLVDFHNLTKKLFSQYSDSKIILLDTGMRQEDVILALLSYKIHGVISVSTDLRLFKKALRVISEGQIWVDNGIVKAFLHDMGIMTKTGKMSGITEREREIIEYICQGYKNKEIASRLSLSEQTVKAHLNRIFKKYNISSRSQLVAINLTNQLTHF
ncbi:MAG: response regulator transcription factor [Nitrospirota bacterium]